MARFVIRYRGPSPAPREALEKLRAVATIIEDGDKMLLVDGSAAALQSALGGGDEWLITPEVTYEHPDPRQRVKR